MFSVKWYFSGLYLQNSKYNLKDWNQLKGRIFSKFSSSKLTSFNDIGFYNFTTLFLTLAIMSEDTSQIVRKTNKFNTYYI